MTDIERKLARLQACLGDKKLKQLGLVTCSTCREIMTQVMNISLPINLENKTFLTSEEMASINQSIVEATNGFLRDTSSTLSSIEKESVSDSLISKATHLIGTYDADSDDDLLSKLLDILQQKNHIVQDQDGIGYTYNKPSVSLYPDALKCSECGRPYSMQTRPKFKLLALPIDLTETEYELIKGVYVDIIL